MKTLIGHPRTITDIIQNRKISWLELFYDLIFAVVLSRLTDAMTEQLSWPTIGKAALLFGWFYWSWHETSGYFDNHGNDSILNVILINMQMIITGITAIYIPEAVAGDLSQIRWGLCVMEFMLLLIWLLIARFDQTHAPASLTWSRVYTIVLLLLIIGSVWVDVRYTSLILTVGILLNFGVVFFARAALKREYELSHLPFTLKDSLIERYGLMTMIALGEIIATLYGTLPKHSTWTAIVTFITSTILVALVSGVYFLVMGEIHITMRSSVQVMMVRWLYLLDIYGVMMTGVLLDVSAAKDTLTFRLAFVATLFMTLWLMWLIERVTHSEMRQRHSVMVMMIELPLLFVTTLFSHQLMVLLIDGVLLLVLAHYVFSTRRMTNSSHDEVKK